MAASGIQPRECSKASKIVTQQNVLEKFDVFEWFSLVLEMKLEKAA